jgi:hypothetical protein
MRGEGIERFGKTGDVRSKKELTVVWHVEERVEHEVRH